MMKRALSKIFLAALLILTPLLSLSAEAALGDFLYKWGDNGSGYYSPWGLSVDGSGNTYVVDTANHTVQVISNTGKLLRKWGTYGDGDGQFDFPKAIAVDSNGNVYVADTNNNRVQVFSNTGTFLRKWGGVYSPRGIAVDGSGNVYVSETSNNRIQVFSSTGAFLKKWGTYGSGDGQFIYPQGIAVDGSGNVYVADPYNHRVQIFDNAGTFLRKWGTKGSGDGQFYYPYGIAVDSTGSVHVADTYNNRIQVFSNTGVFLGKWGSAGSADSQLNWPYGIAVDTSGNVYVADTGNQRVQVFSKIGEFLGKLESYNPGDGLFSYPYGIATDGNGKVYVADTSNYRIQVFTDKGTFVDKWGVYGPGDGQFRAPLDLAVDGSGNIYVVERWNHRVQVFSSTGTFLRKWGVYGSGDGQFNSPMSIAVDSSGNVYVVDTGNARIQVFNSTGTFLRKWGSFGVEFFQPTGIDVDGTGKVYVVGDNRVQVFTNSGTFLRKWGESDGSGDGDGELQLNGFGGLAVDSSGNVYVADTGNNRIQVFSDTGIFKGKWGLPGSGDGQFKSPNSIAIDSTGNVFVADSRNHRIQVFEGYKNCVLTADAGTGQTLEQTSPTGASVVLNGSTTSQGCTGTLTYEWSWPGGSATGANPTVPIPPGTTNMTLAVKSGTFSTTDTIAITVRDTQAPATAALITGTTGNNGWYLTDASLYLSASDSGSGVKEIHYGIDGAETIIADGIASFTIGAEGPHSVAYYAKDNAGNPEGVHSLTVNIDKTPPTITASVSQASNPNGWNNTDVTVTFTCGDTLSGIAACPAPITVSTEGAGQIVSATAIDKAGNSATVSVSLSIDKTLPAISITGVANGATYVLGSAPTAGYTVTDVPSGVATQSANLTGGIANGAGTYTYTVTATDRAGNAANVDAVYSVVYGFGGFLPPVSLGKPFKLGSTVPVKFQLTDVGGAYISTANATIMIQKFSGDQPVDEPIEVTSTSSADTGNTFRYSAADNLYIYNLSTDGLSEGTWQIRATLDDGTVKTAFILLRLK